MGSVEPDEIPIWEPQGKVELLKRLERGPDDRRFISETFTTSTAPPVDRIGGCFGFVFNPNGQLLLVRHPTRGRELPGGRIEPGETPAAAFEPAACHEKRKTRPRGGAGSVVDGFTGVLASVKTATFRDNAQVEGVPASYFRFGVPKQRMPTGVETPAAIPRDMQVSSIVEAWIDRDGRPLRVVNKMSMTSRTVSTTMTMTLRYEYVAVAPFAVPTVSAAFSVPSAADATKLLYG